MFFFNLLPIGKHFSIRLLNDLYIFVEWRSGPNRVSSSYPLIWWAKLCWLELQVGRVPAPLQCIVIRWCCFKFRKCFFIRWNFRQPSVDGFWDISNDVGRMVCFAKYVEGPSCYLWMWFEFSGGWVGRYIKKVHNSFVSFCGDAETIFFSNILHTSFFIFSILYRVSSKTANPSSR